MAFKWFQCKNCAITIKKDSTHRASGCSTKTYHNWSKLGDLGDTNYSFKKCGTVVQTKSIPSTSGCPEALKPYYDFNNNFLLTIYWEMFLYLKISCI